MTPFRGKEEFRKVFDRLFLALASDPEIAAPFHQKWVAILKAEGLSHLLA